MRLTLQMPEQLIRFLAPPIAADPTARGGPLGLLWAREQLVTVLLRVGAILGLINLLLSAPPLLVWEQARVLAIDTGVLLLIWALALYRRLEYRIRGAVFLLGLYTLAITELLHFGYDEDAQVFFVGFALLALLVFNRAAGAAGLLLSVGTLALVGFSISHELFTPLSGQTHPIRDSTVITTTTNFMMVVGAVQVAIALLLRHLDEAWQQENQARTTLEHERDLLEQRVADRTEALARAHAQAVAASSYEAAQNEYLAALHQTTLDLLNRREVGDLLQAIVERAAAILDAPYGELMLLEGEDLVVRAFTRNQSFLRGDRARRGEALLSWQAYDTQQPVILDDYSTWSGHRVIYDEATLCAVADFPILAGQRCLGVLAMGRSVPGQRFTEEDIQHGQTLSQLAALVLDNANLYATALREIADRVQAEQALQQSAEELRAHNAELDAFAHTVAHDLKNPLTSMIGYSSMLQTAGALLPPDQLDYAIAAIGRAGQKMSRIIDELLLLASVRSLDSVPIATLATERLLDETEARLAEMLAAAQATIVRSERWPAAVGYAPWVEEVWVNYVSNAIKYGGSPPRITLGADAPAGGFVRFWVQDNGPGLSQEQQARLFTPFTRLGTSRVEGHGLGLSIVQRIVQKLGGEAGVQSAPGQGSRFFFTLPAADRGEER